MIKSSHKIVFLFSGQGSHYRSMGSTLYENNSVFKNSLMQSEAIVQRHLGKSLIHEIYTTPTRDFNDLLITHPAIVAVEIAMYDVLKSINILPNYVLGSSLGAFAAAVANGVWNAETAIEAAIAQARSIVNNTDRGGMLAIINQEGVSGAYDYSKYGLFLASNNFEGHFTLSGATKDIDVFQSELDRSGIPFLRLPVEIPFHSPLIDQGLYDFRYYMQNVMIRYQPKPGFISGITGEELHDLPKNYFEEVISKYINFPEIVKRIEYKGPCLYIDLGPSGTSATFVKYNLSKTSTSETFQIMTPYGRELTQLKKLSSYKHMESKTACSGEGKHPKLTTLLADKK